jgi:Sec-independent protein secretion pathway component TatC
MKNKFLLLLLKRSNTIVKYVFWSYLIFIIGYYYLFNEVIPALMGYIFWLFLGIHLGYLLSIKAMSYNNKP